MKNFLLALCFIVPTLAFAAEQTVVLHVPGNCNSCRKNIVKATEKVDGVSDADWDKKSKKLTATFDDKKTNVDAITKAVLAAGYDVEDKKAENKAYDKLPDCCKYRDTKHD
jgi:mercuric transport protein